MEQAEQTVIVHINGSQSPLSAEGASLLLGAEEAYLGDGGSLLRLSALERVWVQPRTSWHRVPLVGERLGYLLDGDIFESARGRLDLLLKPGSAIISSAGKDCPQQELYGGEWGYGTRWAAEILIAPVAYLEALRAQALAYERQLSKSSHRERLSPLAVNKTLVAA